jgi:tetratricopeptide (TPR) repeat protein
MKTRNSKKREINLNPNKKSPSNFRLITEPIGAFIRSEKHVLLASLSGVFFFCLLLYMIVQLSHTIQMQQQLVTQREKLQHDISFWQQVTKDRPEYRDGYFMLAVLQYRMGKTIAAKKNVAKALEIDPNFKEGKSFRQLVGE